MSKQRFINAAAICLIVLTVPAMAVEPGPQGVSPGATDRIARVGGACPTFSWEATSGATRYELVVHRYDDEARTSSSRELSPDTEVLFTAVSGRATSWTPEASDCFASGGAHVWFVRAVTDAERGVGSEWSEPRFFEVDASPSPEQVQQALDVLERYLGTSEGEIELEAFTARDQSPVAGTETRGDASSTTTTSSLRSVITGTAAIRGEQPDPSGETYGVVGVSASPDGAGIGAANTAGGPDLVLDGVVPAELSETGVDRPSAAAQGFSFGNSGGGGLTLDVDGVDVVTTATDQNTTYSAGSGLFLNGTQFTPNWDVAQRRVYQSCAVGTYIREIRSNGTVTCHPDQDQDTTYTNGFGLNLSGTQFSVNDAIIQRRVDQSCSTGMSIRVINSNGTVTCQLDHDENTTYTNGFGLNLSAGNQFSVNDAIIQRRVDGTCPAGSSIRIIHFDGAVTCETDDTGTKSIEDGTLEAWARPSVRAHSLGQILSPGSNIAAFPTENWDPDGMHSGNDLATYFSPQVPGLYLVTATLAFDGSVDLRREVRLIHRDATQSKSTIIASTSALARTVSLSTVYSFHGDGDRAMIEILVGGAENMSGTVPSNFTMTWIAPLPTP
ncbi:MAG: hypothetical protein DRJ65_17000 [Acidobacteria bacterium]|nr:MAG: hypothetical protein DRJ65_17000 [Acidobacteriota bacterium]